MHIFDCYKEKSSLIRNYTLNLLNISLTNIANYYKITINL